ncbi:MAG: LUD domain-containing protein [Thermoguttaceae bacterium]|nr:LUD domain-containing protein [Thermoguttaceae bacterium]
MNSRDQILQKIRSSMVPVPEPSIPELPPLFESKQKDAETMKKTFADALTALTGKFYAAESTEEARGILAKLAQENGWDSFSSTKDPFLEKLLPSEFFHGKGKKRLYLGEKNGETDKNRLAEIPVSLLFPQFLIADTGSCVMLNRTPHERLNCYLTPACVMCAFTSQLRENLQAAWDAIAETAADPEIRGEYVLVTGPSRTADIERVSVLGVHGPKTVCVLLIQDQTAESVSRRIKR